MMTVGPKHKICRTDAPQVIEVYIQQNNEDDGWCQSDRKPNGSEYQTICRVVFGEGSNGEKALIILFRGT